MEESNYWTRLGNRRITRRYLLGAGATTAAGLAAMSVVGCGGGGGGTADPPPTRTPNPDGTPLAGGEIVQGRSINALGIDPHIDLTGLDIDLLLYSYMYGWNSAKEEIIFNNFAETFEQPDDQNLEFVYTLKPGFIVHPGAPGAGEELNSTDVLESFVRRGTSLSAPDKRFPTKIAGGADPSGTLLRAALEAPDPQTFRFTMKEPFVPAIRELANPTWAIVPAKVIDEYLSLSQDAFGTGPFMLSEFRGTERIVLVKNPDYPLSPRPWLDKITYIIIQENSSLLTAFKSNQHDVCGAFLTKNDYDEFAEDEQGRFTTAFAPSAFYPCIHLKMRPPFDDIKVRKAINLALNRDEFISGLQDGEGWYNGPIQHVQQFWALPQEELREFYKYDPEGARTLLAEAGYENGFSTTMKLPKLQGIAFVSEYALLIQQQLALVGIDVQLDEVELGAFIGSTILPGNFEMAFFPNLPYDEPDRPLSFYHSLGVTGSGNWTNYNNQKLDALINQQSVQFDKDERKATILEAQRMILEEHGPQLTLTAGIQYTARWNYVHYPYEFGLFGQDPPPGVGPVGTDTWTSEYPPDESA
jgi:ABC-type transport system substrate-binding protein